jgi:hypothetical protein
MRSLFLSAALGLGSLGLIAATPSRAEASWLSEALHAYFDPYYYGGYYSPAYAYPWYGYYGPGYVYSYPSYSYYSVPYYYGPARRDYWGGWGGRHGYWRGHPVWHGGYRGGGHRWHVHHR